MHQDVGRELLGLDERLKEAKHRVAMGASIHKACQLCKVNYRTLKKYLDRQPEAHEERTEVEKNMTVRLDARALLERRAYQLGFALTIEGPRVLLKRYAPQETGYYLDSIEESSAFLHGYQVGIG